MKTPVKVTLEEYRQERREWLDKQALSGFTTGHLVCVNCGGVIRAQVVTLDVHNRELPGCQGDGETMETAVPYCVDCEELPAKRGCVHV